MKTCLFLFLLCISVCARSQDYRIYHRYINNAERCFFIDNKVDSTFSYYDLAFASFDFVFAKDCYMAAQIAYFKKNDRYISYLRKGFKNGLQPRYLTFSTVLSGLMKDSIAFHKKFADYAELRKVYLKRINVHMFKEILRRYEIDQVEKNGDENEYPRRIYKQITYIESLIKTVGFPGDRLIGIDQRDIMHELGYENADYPPRQYDEIDYYRSFSPTHIFVLLVHYVCAYKVFANYWDSLIITGQIHPGDVAMLHDNDLRLFDNWRLTPTELNSHRRQERIDIANKYLCPSTPPYGSYNNNVFASCINIQCNGRIIDSMRAALYMPPQKVDTAKIFYRDKHGFITEFGFWDSR